MPIEEIECNGNDGDMKDLESDFADPLESKGTQTAPAESGIQTVVRRKTGLITNGARVTSLKRRIRAVEKSRRLTEPQRQRMLNSLGEEQARLVRARGARIKEMMEIIDSPRKK